MCGIMGYYAFRHNRPDKTEITEMFKLLEIRGRDASGFAYINDGNLIVYKEAVKASLLVATTDWHQLTLPKIFIAHTRMKTQGTEKKNVNNHPIYNKQGLCIVHNGIIHNDKEIFGKHKRDGEVDSESILHILASKSKKEPINKLFERIEGSFAVASINVKTPDLLTLIKKDNPIELYYDKLADIVYFCSEQDIMQEALKIKPETIRGFKTGEGDFYHYTMDNNHSLLIGPDGVIDYKRYYGRSRYDRGWRSNYHTRYEDLDEADITDSYIVECPWCLNETLFIQGKLINRCKMCGIELNEEDVLIY